MSEKLARWIGYLEAALRLATLVKAMAELWENGDQPVVEPSEPAGKE